MKSNNYDTNTSNGLNKTKGSQREKGFQFLRLELFHRIFLAKVK
uniref:Uncharacterized protein n=1 Tax=Tetraselmis sp. GSL018 TaxID=582737 RepID=A0A061S4T5_9CHLO